MRNAKNDRVREMRWRAVEMPVVDETLCTGCGWCPDACPTDCLAMNKHLPYLPRPLDCVSCGLCVLICPVGALEMADFSVNPS